MRSTSGQLFVAATLFAIGLSTPLLAYAPLGHEIVGAIADERLANTPTATKIRTLLDGLSLEKAAVIADEIKGWDKKGADNPKAFHYFAHPKIDRQLRDFWRANQPTHDANSAMPSHHWFHYTDVPVLNVHRYSDGTTGRTQWDIVHMISYCVDVLRGEVPENNPRKITKPVAIILLAHYLGDIHQPLHVGAEYFNQAGHAVDPDKNQPGIEDEGGNTLMLELVRGTPEEMAHRPLKLHGFWDSDAVMANLPPLSPTLTKEERYQKIDHGKRNLIDRFVKESFGEIEVALTPPCRGENVESVSERIAVVAQLGGSYGRFRAVGRGGVVGVHLVRPRDPSEQHGRHGGGRTLEAPQRALVQHARLAPLAKLVESAPLVDERAGRWLLPLGVDEAEMRHAGEGTVRRRGHEDEPRDAKNVNTGGAAPESARLRLALPQRMRTTHRCDPPRLTTPRRDSR